MNNSLKNNNGTALFMALLILTGMLVVVLAASDIITRGIKMSRTQARSTKAYFAAEAGAERILWEVRKNNFDDSFCSDNDYINFDTNPATCDSSIRIYFLSNNASYSVVYSSGPSVTFTSNGIYLSNRRSVELSY
ncbi:MAG: pilus assembly PilX N-terminal domain-containing protein [Patescibacteria group bacterium]|nr:pilus assembly PilX N-terminal domain-containing protein [Patescibacteria group bacterium]